MSQIRASLIDNHRVGLWQHLDLIMVFYLNVTSAVEWTCP